MTAVTIADSTAAGAELSYLRRAFLPFSAATSALAAPLFNFLHYHEYPILSAEVALLLIGQLILAASVALLYVGQRRWGRVLLEVVLIFVAADLTTKSFWIPAAAALLALAFLLIRRISLLPFVTIMGLVVIATSFLGLSDRRPWIETPRTTSSPSTKQQLTLLHIILDEHAGIEGLPKHSSSAVLVKDELKEFYQNRGFRLYGRAYSEHFETVNSIPSIVNYGGTPMGTFSRTGGSLSHNEYFQTLAAQGFAVRVFQSEYLDFCEDDAVRECTSYWSPSLVPLSSAPLAAREKASLILANFLYLSDYLVYGGRKYDYKLRKSYPRLARNWTINLRRRGRASSVASMQAFDLLARKLEKARPGDAYFAHILLPHSPYAFDSECRLLPKADWQFRRSYGDQRRMHQGHEMQLRCVQKKVAQALDAIGKSEAGTRNLAVIIHGDHGSRIVRRDPVAPLSLKYDPDDLVRGFSTLFAIRAPGIVAGYEEEAAPVSWLLSEASRSHFLAVRGASFAPKARRIFIADRQWKVRSTANLPADW